MVEGGFESEFKSELDGLFEGVLEGVFEGALEVEGALESEFESGFEGLLEGVVAVEGVLGDRAEGVLEESPGETVVETLRPVGSNRNKKQRGFVRVTAKNKIGFSLQQQGGKNQKELLLVVVGGVVSEHSSPTVNTERVRLLLFSFVFLSVGGESTKKKVTRLDSKKAEWKDRSFQMRLEKVDVGV